MLNFRMLNPPVTKRNIITEHTQKKMRDLNISLQKINQLNTKDSNSRNEGQKS